jgi:septal ring factor EnvC (AmiA/AmiB activator)
MSDVIERINAYLFSGGMFNPELANHDAVRDLLIDARAELAAMREQRDALRRVSAAGTALAGMLADKNAEINKLRAELAATIHEKENRIIERNEAESLLKQARAELAALSARHERALIQGAKLRESLEPFAKFKDHWPIVPTHEDYERARAVLKETGDRRQG